MAKTIAVDFDGVINSYTSGFVANRIPDPPVEGAFDFLLALQAKGHDVVVLSTRASNGAAVDLMRTWFRMHGYPDRQLGRIVITNRKPKAGLYIDDRGFRFEGTFPTVAEVNRMAESPWRPALPEVPPVETRVSVPPVVASAPPAALIPSLVTDEEPKESQAPQESKPSRRGRSSKRKPRS